MLIFVCLFFFHFVFAFRFFLSFSLGSYLLSLFSFFRFYLLVHPYRPIILSVLSSLLFFVLHFLFYSSFFFFNSHLSASASVFYSVSLRFKKAFPVWLSCFVSVCANHTITTTHAIWCRHYKWWFFFVSTISCRLAEACIIENMHSPFLYM